MNKNRGFTIVELLVVIVVIGVLAAVTIVSYTGISKRATVASLQSDLDNASRQLKLFSVDNSTFPASVTDCSISPDTLTNKCLRLSSENKIDSYTSTVSSFTLTIKNGTVYYRITENSIPVLVIATPITAIGSITGTTQDGEVLTAGALTPSDATVSYQWQNSATSGGTYNNISGATGSTYTQVTGDVGMYIKVVVTGTGTFSGSATSAPTSVVIASPWATIGTQKWATSNVNSGTWIIGTTNQTNNAVLEKYCPIQQAAQCDIYGGIYQWDEAMQYVTTEGAQGVCPTGSHIPTDAELTTLLTSLGGNAVAGDKLKQAGTSLWSAPNNGTNSSGFSALPAGMRANTGTMYGRGSYADFWTSTQNGGSAYVMEIYYSDPTVWHNIGSTYAKTQGVPVRCIKN